MKNEKLILIWSARLMSLMMITLIIILGIMTYGLADSGTNVRVNRDLDETFKTEKASLLTSNWNTMEDESELIRIPEGLNIFSFVSEIKDSDFEFTMIGAKMTSRIEGGTSVDMSVRVSEDAENWGGWIEMEMEKDKEDNIKYVSENPILLDGGAKYAQYKLILNSDVDNKAPEIYNVELIYLNPEDSLAIVKKGWNWVVDQVVGSESVNIIEREQWGADESIMTWDEFEYAPVEQIIVHHTAGSNNAPSDSAAVVRGIYYFHAVEKDWGDIGYNYIIDHKGNVYEGRKGGLGVVAAHSSGNNYGSVGISIIGNYVEDAPSANALKALIDMVGYVGYQAGIDVTAKHTFEGENIPVLAGHRDVNSTECPGDVLYSMLSDVAKAAKQGNSDLPERVFEGRFVDQSKTQVDVKSNETAYINVTFENSGSAVWVNQASSVVLVPTEPYPRNSGFVASDWNNSQIVGPVSTSSVMPGDKIVYKLNLKGIKGDGIYTEKFALKGPGGILKGTEFEVKINTSVAEEVVENSNVPNTEAPVVEQPKTENSQIVQPENNNEQKADDNTSDLNLYHSAWVGQSEHLKLYSGEEQTVWIDIKNTGTTTWYRDGQYPVRLGTTRPDDRNSGFVADGSRWLSPNRIEMVQWGVEPGEVARFRFSMKGVNQSGEYKEYFRPVVDGLGWMEDQGIYVEIVIEDSEYGASLVAQSDHQMMINKGDKVRLWVELKNTGNVVWRKNGDYPVRMGTDNDLDRASLFYSKNFWVSENRPAEMKKTMVYPGESVKFDIVITAPDKAGVYREQFRPVVENLQWMEDLGIQWEIVVR